MCYNSLILGRIIREARIIAVIKRNWFMSCACIVGGIREISKVVEIVCLGRIVVIIVAGGAVIIAGL